MHLLESEKAGERGKTGQPGAGRGGKRAGGERRVGEEGEWIMNTTDQSLRTSPLMSCKNSIGRAGPGGVKQASNLKADASNVSVSNAGSRDLTYVPYTSPPSVGSLSRRGSCHASRSNRVTRTRIHHTCPSKSTGGRPLLTLGALANASPSAVLPSLETGNGAGCAYRSPSPTPSVARERGYKAAVQFSKIRGGL